jgi:hypothetical protein
MSGDPLGDDGKALVDAWAAIAGISTLVPGGLHEGPLTQPPALPYASYTIKQGPRPPEFSTNGDWINYSEIGITVWGVGATAVATVMGGIASGLASSTFNPANADVMRFERLAGDTNEAEDIERKGDQIRKCTLHYCLWTHRRA